MTAWLKPALLLAFLIYGAGSEIRCQERSEPSPLLKIRDDKENLLDLEIDPGACLFSKGMLKEEGYTLLPDSAEESVNLGYKHYYRKWYYQYDPFYRLDTLFKLYYDEDWNRDDITAIETYNAAGNLLSYVRRQRDSWAMMVYGDSSILDYYREDYTWEDGKLVKEEISNHEFGDDYREITYHVYDDSGLLVLDSTSWGGTTQYNYYENGDLWYTYYYQGIYQNFAKYTYERTDTSCFTTVQMVYYYTPDQDITIDTISHWNFSQYYEEYFDEEGRKISLLRKYNNGYGELNDYRADYQYTEWGALESAQYYDWMATQDSGEWLESTRITNQYNEEQKIVHYENWFWDARIEEWVPEYIREYYYSPVSTALDIVNSHQQEIGLYPNPVRDILYLKSEPDAFRQYTIFDFQGNVLRQGGLMQNQIGVSNLPPGLYILEITSNTSRCSARFIKY